MLVYRVTRIMPLTPVVAIVLLVVVVAPAVKPRRAVIVVIWSRAIITYHTRAKTDNQ